MRATGGRALLLLLLIVLAGLSIAALPGLTFDHSTRSLMRADEAAAAREARLGQDFGAEDILLVTWETGAVLDAAGFAKVRAVTEKLQAIPGLEEVYSIATPDVLLGIGGAVRPLTPDDFATEERREVAHAALRRAPVYVGTIYSPELDVVAVASSLSPGSRADREHALEAVRAVAEPDGLWVSGVTPFAIEASEYAIQDLRRIGLLALAVAVIVLFALSRSIRETAVAVFGTGLPPLFALGLASALGLPLTALGAALFPVMAVVGITSSVHLLNAYGEERARIRDPGLAAVRAARRLAPPILLSLLTTAAAFFSLQATGVPAFHAAGNVVGLGLVAAVPVILLGIPAALALVRPPPRARHTHRLDRLLLASAGRIYRQPAPFLVAGAALALAGALLVPTAKLRVQVLQAFQPSSHIAKTYGFLERRLTATVPVDFILQARDDASDAEILEDLRRFSREAEKIDGVDSTLGLDDLVAYGMAISPVGEKLALVFLRGALGAITSRFEDLKERRYRVKLRLRDGTGPKALDRLEALARQTRSGEASLAGLFVLAVGTTRNLVADLARGSFMMTLLVVLTVAAALRSWRLGLAALLPNLLPPLAVFGTAALFGYPLDVSAVAVGAVAIGLAIDDTLHVVFRVREERRRGRSARSVLLRSQRSVGRALVLSTVVLAAGLGCLLLSSFLPTARFGLFCAAASVVALLADLLVLPALLRTLRCL